MIGRLRGMLAARTADGVVLDVGGVGYEIHMTPRDMATLPGIGEQVVLHTHLHVREDVMSLYGFDGDSTPRPVPDPSRDQRRRTVAGACHVGSTAADRAPPSRGHRRHRRSHNGVRCWQTDCAEADSRARAETGRVRCDSYGNVRSGTGPRGPRVAWVRSG